MLGRVLTVTAERAPAAEALADGDRRLTYRALEARAKDRKSVV